MAQRTKCKANNLRNTQENIFKTLLQAELTQRGPKRYKPKKDKIDNIGFIKMNAPLQQKTSFKK